MCVKVLILDLGVFEFFSIGAHINVCTNKE